MKRSAGVLTAGIVLLVGSLVMLALAVLVGVAFVVVGNTAPDTAATVPPSFAKFGMIVGLVMVLVPAIWGIITSVGIFRLKAWARVSMIVIGVLTAFFNLCSAAVMLVLPLTPPPNAHTDAAVFNAIRMGMVVFYVVLAGIGVWWAVLFTRRSVKAQFAPAGGDSQPALPTPPPAYDSAGLPVASNMAPPRVVRPIGVSIIGWFLIVTAIFFPINVLLHAPLVMLGKVLVGPIATTLLVFFTVINVVLGIGLLRLNERARQATIVVCLFGVVNSSVSFLGPGHKARIAAIMNAQPEFVRQASAQNPIDITPFMWIGTAVGALMVAVVLYVLIAARPAFDCSHRNSN